MTDEAAGFLDEIDALLGDGLHDWATETLNGIAETVKRCDAVTKGQRRAAANVARGSREDLVPSDGYKSSRRYEGWAPPR